MKRCLTQEQIERLADARPGDWPPHARTCAECRTRLDAARQNAEILRDVVELDRSRERIRPLLARDLCEPPQPGAARQ